MVRINLKMQNGLIIHNGDVHHIVYDNPGRKELSFYGNAIDPPIIQDGIIIHTITYMDYGFDLEYSLLEDYLISVMIERTMLVYKKGIVGTELSGNITVEIEVEQSEENGALFSIKDSASKMHFSLSED